MYVDESPFFAYLRRGSRGNLADIQNRCSVRTCKTYLTYKIRQLSQLSQLRQLRPGLAKPAK